MGTWAGGRMLRGRALDLESETWLLVLEGWRGWPGLCLPASLPSSALTARLWGLVARRCGCPATGFET